MLTLLLALEARVVLYHGGKQSLADFAAAPRQRDILTHVIIPKGERRVVYLSQRNTATDFPVLTCALSRREGRTLCAVGARPGRAEPFEDKQGLLAGGITPEGAQTFAREAAGRFRFGSNLRGSAQYRQEICQVLVRRGLLAMEGE